MSTLAAIAAFPACAVVIRLLFQTGLRRRLVAVPSSERWHDTPTPLFGGVGIFAGLTVGIWLAAAIGAMPVTHQLAGIYAGVSILFVAGLVDDLYALSPRVKLALQIAAAIVVLTTGTGVELIHTPFVAWPLAVLWLVGMTNAFNLLDNMDGLAATLAAIAFSFFAIDAVTIHPNHFHLVLALAGAAACAGFLPFNLRPRGKALVFMGDSGSQLLGFALAALGLAASWNVAGSTVATFLLPILILAVPVLDTTLVTVVRLLEGRPISQGGRDHSSHRLVRFGLSEKHAVLLLALISVALGGTSLAYNVLSDQRLAVLGVLVTFVLLVQFASFLADAERRTASADSGLADAFAVHWRRTIEVVVDFGLILGAFGAAYILIFGWPGTTSQRSFAAAVVPILIATRYLAFIFCGLYRAIWRFAAARDLVAIGSAVLASEVVSIAYVAVTRSFGDFTRTFFVLDALFCAVAIAGSRFAERALVRGRRALGGGQPSRRSLIVGAGRTGRSLLRELQETPGERVVGFLDDNPRLRRRRVHGVSVVGNTSELGAILPRLRPEIVLVTIPDAGREKLDPLVAACEEAGVPCRFVRREIDLDPRVVLGTVGE